MQVQFTKLKKEVEVKSRLAKTEQDQFVLQKVVELQEDKLQEIIELEDYLQPYSKYFEVNLGKLADLIEKALNQNGKGQWEVHNSSSFYTYQNYKNSQETKQVSLHLISIGQAKKAPLYEELLTQNGKTIIPLELFSPTNEKNWRNSTKQLLSPISQSIGCIRSQQCKNYPLFSFVAPQGQTNAFLDIFPLIENDLWNLIEQRYIELKYEEKVNILNTIHYKQNQIYRYEKAPVYDRKKIGQVREEVEESRKRLEETNEELDEIMDL